MRYISKVSILSGFAVLALAGCKQENNYPAVVTSTEAIVTEVVPVPGPTSTTTIVVPVPGPTSTVTATPSADAATPKP